MCIGSCNLLLAPRAIIVLAEQMTLNIHVKVVIFLSIPTCIADINHLLVRSVISFSNYLVTMQIGSDSDSEQLISRTSLLE